MPEFVGFQTMVILDHNGVTFDAVDLVGLAFQLLFKSDSSVQRRFLISKQSLSMRHQSEYFCAKELKDKFLKKEDINSNCAQ